MSEMTNGAVPEGASRRMEETRSDTRRRPGGRPVTIGLVVSGIVAVCGIVLWVMQLSGGLVQTGMRNLDSWGLYITLFMFLVGLSAGGLIISSVPKALGLTGFGGIAKVAVWTSICCTVLAIVFVVVDMGHPGRLWELLVFANMGSPLMWDVIVLCTYLVLSVGYLWAMGRVESGRMKPAVLRVVSVVALVVAVLVHSVTAWIFGLQAGREMWHTAILAPWFVSSALVCGTALVLVTVLALRHTGYLVPEEGCIERLAKMLGAFVCVDLYFFGCDLLNEGYPGGAGASLVETITAGPLAPFFWTELIGCALCAVVCFVPRLRTVPLLSTASVLAMAAIFCKRVILLVGGFQAPNLGQPTPLNEMSITYWENGMEAAYQGLVYWPSPLEFGVAAGVVGLGMFLFLLGIRFLPLRPRS